MESEYTETANQFLDCVNKLNVHTCAFTSLQKQREKKILSESVVFKMQSYELLL